MLFDSIIDAIGRTPMVRLRMPSTPAVEVYAKLELQNLFGMKDRVARNIILEARRVGVLAEGAPIVESSSGTMALGVALVGAALGHPVHIVTDPRIDPMTLGKLQALGSEVHIVDLMRTGGWQTARLERLATLMAGLPGAFWPQQYSNPDNPRAYRALAAEIVSDLGRIDTLVGSVGSGGSLCGTSRALREEQPDLFVVGVDCVGSALFDQPDQPRRLQSGLGNSLVPNNLDYRLIDEVQWLNDHEAFAATRALAAEQQIFAGNTSGSVYQVLADVAGRARPGSRIVGIFPDRGDRYIGTIYDDPYWQANGVRALPLSATPESVDYGTQVESWSRAVHKRATGPRPCILFIEANTSGTGMLALSRAEAVGLRPVLICSRPERYQGLDETGAEVIVCDTNSAAALRSLIQERFPRADIAAVTSTSDFYIPTVAELARWLGLPGNPVEAAEICRDKGRLRTRLAEQGVAQPRFAVLSEPLTPDDLTTAIAAVGLPCVVKPVDDSGSNEVLRCDSPAAVRAQVLRILSVTTNVRGLPTSRTVLIEEYLPGPEYSVELFGGPAGTVCLGITEKQVTEGPSFVEYQHVFPAPLEAERSLELERAARSAVEATGMCLGATHTEVKLTTAGARIVEVNPRPAGGMIPELIRLVTGIDLLDLQLRASAGLPLEADLPPQSVGHAGIRFFLADRKGTLAGVDGWAEAASVPGVEALSATVRPGAEVQPATSSYHRLGHVIATGDRPEAVLESLTAARRLIQFRVQEVPVVESMPSEFS